MNSNFDDIIEGEIYDVTIKEQKLRIKIIENTERDNNTLAFRGKIYDVFILDKFGNSVSREYLLIFIFYENKQIIKDYLLQFNIFPDHTSFKLESIKQDHSNILRSMKNGAADAADEQDARDKVSYDAVIYRTI